MKPQPPVFHEDNPDPIKDAKDLEELERLILREDNRTKTANATKVNASAKRYDPVGDMIKKAYEKK